ncbi:MAG: LysR family transcriptional regulator, partial [Hyphomicrobiales bacterium]
MQHINWDDFRYFVTLFREGSLSQAANKLGVNATTVSRRVRALEDQLKA